MKPSRWRATVVVSGLLAIAALPLLPRSTLPRSTRGEPDETWRQLSLAEFVAEIERLTQGEEPLGEEVWAAIREQAAERFSGAAGAAVDYGDLVSLYWWARPVLTAEQIEDAREKLRPPTRGVEDWTFEKLRGVQVRMDQAGLTVDAVHALTWAWLEQRDLGAVEDLDQLGWLFAQVQLMDRREIGRQELAVRWTGSVTAPADGAYTFSINPLDLNFEHEGTFREQTTRIWIGQQLVLNSAAEGWTYEGNPVTLAGGVGAPMRIEWTFTCSSQGVIDGRPAVAQLYWEGPGLSRRLVPATALTPPDDVGSGLRGEYQVGAGEDPHRATRLDAAIDFIQTHADWTAGLAVDFYAANREVYRELSRRMVTQYPGHLEALEQEYLELADGGCAVPLAYILAYGYWVQGRIGDWIEQLEARLADDGLSGDRRVGWLLARAQAEEIRRSPHHEHWYTMDRYLAGRGWLEEATLVAQGEGARLRGFLELAAREAADERLDAVERMLDQAARRCTGVTSSETLTRWRADLDGLRQAVETRRETRQAAARATYIERLRARHRNALERGDSAAADRLEQRLAAAGAARE